jgi:hypothetical protein
VQELGLVERAGLGGEAFAVEIDQLAGGQVRGGGCDGIPPKAGYDKYTTGGFDSHKKTYNDMGTNCSGSRLNADRRSMP